MEDGGAHKKSCWKSRHWCQNSWVGRCPGERAGVSHGHWDDLEILNQLISCGPAESNVKGFVGLCLKSTFLSCVSISKVYFLHVYFLSVFFQVDLLKVYFLGCPIGNWHMNSYNWERMRWGKGGCESELWKCAATLTLPRSLQQNTWVLQDQLSFALKRILMSRETKACL